MSEREIDSNRPYAPASNVAMFLDRIRTRNLPDRIDRDYLLDSGISETLVSRVSFALRFLGFLDGETPTPALRAIAVSTDDEYREILLQQLQGSYSDVFAVVDPTRDSSTQILNVFRKFTPGSQRDRMVSFFLAMCKEAGIEVLDTPRERQREPSSLPRPKVKPTQAPTRSRDKTSTLKVSNGTAVRTLPVEGMAAPLALLVQSLPPPGTPLPPTKRDQWLRMAEATLEFLYPETETQIGNEVESD